MCKGCNYTWTSKLANPNDVNCALSYFVQFGPTGNQRLRVTAGLLTQVLKEPAFNVLRTKEQLGYVVSLSGWTLPGGNELGLRVVVQSERTAEYCETRVEAFFDAAKIDIEEMTDEVFQEQKNGLEKKWREATKNLAEETAVYQTHIDSGHLDFLRSECLFLRGCCLYSVFRREGRGFAGRNHKRRGTFAFHVACPSDVQDAVEVVGAYALATSTATSSQLSGS